MLHAERGFIHFFPALLIAGLAYLARRRPLEEGITLVIVGILAGGYFFMTLYGTLAFQLQSALMGGAPFLLCGLLLICAAVLSREKVINR